MPVLTEPTPRVHASFLGALREYRAEGAYTRLDPADLADADRFRRFLDQLRAQALRFWVPTTPRVLWRQRSAGGSRSCGRPAPRSALGSGLATIAAPLLRRGGTRRAR